jgi:hypothetical protein
MPNPQQHILPPLPPAPQASTTAVPVPGANQQNPDEKLVLTLPGVYAHIIPCSRFSSSNAMKSCFDLARSLNEVGMLLSL